jgi:hypothetical protein
MSKYRCPLCGANHKNDAERCRLCGQSLAPGSVSQTPRGVSQPVRAQRGIKGIILIGLGLVLTLAVGAVVFGQVNENNQIRKAKDLVSGSSDGWSAQEEAEGQFTVDLPSPRTRIDLHGTATATAVDDGKLTGWQTSTGEDTGVPNDTVMLAAWGTVSPPLKNDEITSAAAMQYLNETVVTRWAVANGLNPAADLVLHEATLGGLPAIVAQSTQARSRLGTRDAFVQTVFALKGTTLYMLDVTSVLKDAPQFMRMANSFRLIGTTI